MKKTFIISLLFIFLIVPQAFGITIPFGDNSKYWPGWHNGQASDDTDRVGVPNFTGGSVTVGNTGLLENITFNYSDYANSILAPAGLFIDIGANNTWDYYVDIDINAASSKTAGNRSLYTFTSSFSSQKGVNDNWYILSGQDNTNPWVGHDIRDNHPIKVENGDGQSLIQAESIVTAMGFRPNPAMYQILTDKFRNVHLIGDCRDPRNIMEAISEGAEVGRAL